MTNFVNLINYLTFVKSYRGKRVVPHYVFECKGDKAPVFNFTKEKFEDILRSLLWSIRIYDGPADPSVLPKDLQDVAITEEDANLYFEKYKYICRENPIEEERFKDQVYSHIGYIGSQYKTLRRFNNIYNHPLTQANFVELAKDRSDYIEKEYMKIESQSRDFAQKDLEAFDGNRYIDQLFNLITELKFEPFGKRLAINLWSPGDDFYDVTLTKENIIRGGVSSPPTELLLQFSVTPDEYKGKLNMVLSSSNVDIVNARETSLKYKLLLNMIAYAANTEVGKFIWNMTDIYLKDEDFTPMFTATDFQENFKEVEIIEHGKEIFELNVCDFNVNWGKK